MTYYALLFLKHKQVFTLEVKWTKLYAAVMEKERDREGSVDAGPNARYAAYVQQSIKKQRSNSQIR